MRALRRGGALLAAVLLAGCTAAGEDPPAPRPSATASPAAAPATYLALGDSVAAGVGAADPDTQGYVAILADLLSDRLGCDGGRLPGCPVQLRNLAVPGATTTTLLADQLPAALALLESAPEVRLVTVTIGGNDVYLPVVQACADSTEDAACAQAVRDSLRAVEAGVDELLAALAGAVGPRTTVALMTYYDSLPACRLAALSPLAQRVLEGSELQEGLNDVLRARAAEHGALVVETADRLSAPEDFVGGLDCLHPSTSGHERIAEAFLDVVERQVADR